MSPCSGNRRCATWRRPQMRNCASGDPCSRSWLWIPGSRCARPGMTSERSRQSVSEPSERFRSGLMRLLRSSVSSAVSGVDAARPRRLPPVPVPGHSRRPALEPAPPISANLPLHRSAIPPRSRPCRPPPSRSPRRLRWKGKSSSQVFSSWDSKPNLRPFCCIAIVHRCIATMQFRRSLMREIPSC